MASSARERIESDPVSAALYREILNALHALGDYAVEEKKTSFHLTHGRAFLGIHPRRAALLVNIVTERQLHPARMHKTEQVSARRWHNELLLNDPADIDDEVISWFAEAYSLTQG